MDVSFCCGCMFAGSWVQFLARLWQIVVNLIIVLWSKYINLEYSMIGCRNYHWSKIRNEHNRYVAFLLQMICSAPWSGTRNSNNPSAWILTWYWIILWVVSGCMIGDNLVHKPFKLTSIQIQVDPEREDTPNKQIE